MRGAYRRKSFLMRKCILLVGMLLAVGSLSAQRNAQTVYLKNGSEIRGEIVEEVPGESIKVRTRDGNVFVYRMDEVQRITRGETGESTQSTGHRGLDFNVDLGYHIATKGGGGSFLTEVGLGKRFNKNFYWGVGSGVIVPTGDGDLQIPLTTDFKVYFPIRGTRVAPYGAFRTGYVFNTASDQTIGIGKYVVKVEAKNSVLVEIMPGIQVPLSGKADFNFALGYTHFFPTGGGGEGAGAFTLKAGFGFHKPWVKNRNLAPTRDNGFQLTLEAGGPNFWKMGSYEDCSYSGDGEDADTKGFGAMGANIVLGYKWNPNISFGLGYGASYFRYNLKCTDKDGAHAAGVSDNGGVMHKVFLRGQYRLTDSKFSPFVSADLGMRLYGTLDADYVYWNLNTFCDKDVKPKKSGFFLTPAVGVSFRTTNNSYLEARLGYEISGKLSAQEGTYADGSERTVEYDAVRMSGLFFSVGWTHTFKLGSR